MSITFKLRDGEVTIPKKELEVCMFEDWYISKLVSNSIDTEENDTFEIWEDKHIFMCLINSVRLNNLLLEDNYINFDYLYALADKYSVNQKILNEIKEKKELFEYNEKSAVEKYNNFDIQKCINCKAGFSIKNNKEDSCRFHPEMYNNITQRFDCCGYSFNNNDANHPLKKGCVVGYHVNMIDMQIFKQIKNLE